MWYKIAIGVAAFFLTLWLAPPMMEDGREPPDVLADGQGREALVDQVRRSIDRGIQFLRGQEKGKGNWEVDLISANFPGGETCLAMLALLNAGVKPTDPIIERGLKYLREMPRKHTYVVGLQTMVFAAAGKDIDRERIQNNVDWLLAARVMRSDDFEGWTYSKGQAGTDNSNMQYALLGLHEGKRAGAKIDKKTWELIREYYLRAQVRDGSWGYSPQRQENGTLTMTTAGLSGLYISGMELNDGRETLRPDGGADHCGEYRENRPVHEALDWIGKHYRMEIPGAIFYNLYGIERAGRLSGQRFLGSHDWYREGCEFLVKMQLKEDGSFRGGHAHDAWPVVSTSFALLFLSKGRTPILISKLVHGPGDDWNNDHNDARNLVEFASQELFKRQPLAWQSFDAKRVSIDNRNELLALTADLLQSPIVYFNGHQAPKLTETEEDLLKEYVNQGGFILAEACCQRPEFDRGFRALMKKIFPEGELKPLPAEHPIWRAHALVPPGSFKLEGIELGCKTVVVYSPQDMSCRWESNQMESAQSKLAFRLGGNIIAYATGMELPKPRLFQHEIINDKDDTKKVPRGYLKVAQLRHEGDWQPAPRAMRNLMAYLKEKPRLDVALQTEAIRPSHPDLANFKFLYLHGRNRFAFSKPELDALRSDLTTGGLLLADACCGRKEFDTAFRDFAKSLFPDKKLEPIPPTDELFGKELNGKAIKSVRCRRELGEGNVQAEYREVAPFLEGIKHNNRWVVIYSKFDLGCALEKHQAPDCLGHDYDSALKLASAAVYYSFWR